MKYEILVNILDAIVKEADVKYNVLYNPSETDIEKVNQARSRAYIHLFLKVNFGMLDFNKREYYISDGTNDGGIDGYFINEENKTIYFIQSKFRTNKKNFEEKEMKIEEILAMDIDRVLSGEEIDEVGNKYNGKILQLKREIGKISDIARYKYQVVILANLSGILQSKIRLLTGGYPAEIINYEKCYEKLIFPMITGTYFNASDLNIHIDLSNKSSGSKISYTVNTKHSQCEITVLFVPTLEIAKVLNKYKNSILKFNPRSYLELEGQKVNESIKETIMNLETNEFAIFNNGITMISDETFINEKIGQKNKAQLTVKNPQIINGGQTSYTLSRIYDSNIENSDKIFSNKEVLLKIITLIGDNVADDETKMKLIEDVSTATNQQTPVITADRFSNDPLQLRLQKTLFEKYGVLYERKRGEFGDGLHAGYINSEQVIERNLFFRIYNAVNGNINRAVEKKLFMKQTASSILEGDIQKLDAFYFGFLAFSRIYKFKSPLQKIQKNIYGMIYAIGKLYKPANVLDYHKAIDNNLSNFKLLWQKFLKWGALTKLGYSKTMVERATGKRVVIFSESKWFTNSEFEIDVIAFFNRTNFNSIESEMQSASIEFEADLISQNIIQNNKLRKRKNKLEKTKERLQKITEFANIVQVKLSTSETNEAKRSLYEQLIRLQVEIRKLETSKTRQEGELVESVIYADQPRETEG